MIKGGRRRDTSYLFHAGLTTLALTAFLVLSATSAFAQKRVIQKWVNRVDVAQAGGRGATVPLITADTQKNVYVAGNPNYVSQQPNTVISQFLEVIKYNSTGTKVWSDVINTPGYSPVASAITVDSSGNVFLAGLAFTDSPTAEFVVAKVSSSGSTEWFATYSFPDRNGDAYPYSMWVAGIVVDSLGNSYITGWAKEDTSGPITTIKFSPTGARLWVRQFNDGNIDIASGMVLDSQNNVLVTGQVKPCEIGCTGNDVGITIKYNTNGTQLWTAYTGKNTSAPAGTSVYDNTAIAADSSGNAYVAGWFNTNGSTCRPNPSRSAVLCQTGYVVKYSSTGAEVWSQQNALWGSTAIKLDREGSIFTAGSYLTSNSSHFSVTRLNPSGTLLWNRQYQHTSTGDDEAFALAVNYDSDAYVTGQSTSTNNATGFDCVTLKFDYKGDLDWIAVYSGSGSGNDIGSAVTFSQANLYVAAQSVGSNKLPGWALIEYLQDAAVVTPSSRTFSSQKIGTASAAQSVTLTNTYWGTDLKLESINVHGPFSQTNNCSSVIVPFGSCTITITFKPTTTGVQTGSIDIYDQWAGSPAIITLTGTGTN
ncbi:MAG: fibronectin, type [Candidatus Acidoferrum typicum]|jgi:hypothetical protein|nr:fibronectin, type [Candidatus Acidoferrum typicum]